MGNSEELNRKVILTWVESWLTATAPMVVERGHGEKTSLLQSCASLPRTSVPLCPQLQLDWQGRAARDLRFSQSLGPR